MPEIKSKNQGGARLGAGRKAGGQNHDSEDRKLVCAWLCHWFARSLQSRLKRPVSDADCEQFVNERASASNPVFESQKATLGGMWAKARRGERPFSPDRMARVVTAADKLKFWNPRWRRDLAAASGETDQLALLVLSLISVEGLDSQLSEKREFLKRQAALQRSLSAAATCTEGKFEKCRQAALESLRAWAEFTSSLEAGRPGVLTDLEASIDGDDIRRWILHPDRTINRLLTMRYESRDEVLSKAAGQTWALEYRAHNFSDSSILTRHLRNLRSGTKLAQQRLNTSKFDQRRQNKRSSRINNLEVN